MNYIVLLRGINVGGNNTISMAELKAALTAMGLDEVRTYINSGNVVFASSETDAISLAEQVEQIIKKTFGLAIRCVVIPESQLQRIVDQIPQSPTDDQGWRLNLVFLIPPFKIDEVVAAVGELKPDIESLGVGDGVLYLFQFIPRYGRTTTSKIIGKPVYQQMTLRSPGTARKLLQLMKSE